MATLQKKLPKKIISSKGEGCIFIQNGNIFEESGKWLGPAPEQVAGMTNNQLRAYATKHLVSGPVFEEPQQPAPMIKKVGRPVKLSTASIIAPSD